ncbi:hypothetical protein LUZ60_006416 [Juncus effusus]|nr:hypothetical protein LUZ60_006416 [Juncus effusus]
MKVQTFALALLLLLLTSSYLQSTKATNSTSTYSDFCGKKCDGRCSAKGEASRCKPYCLMCCAKCNCVPSGTYGNKDECPCYRDMVSPKTKRSKCP